MVANSRTDLSHWLLCSYHRIYYCPRWAHHCHHCQDSPCQHQFKCLLNNMLHPLLTNSVTNLDIRMPSWPKHSTTYFTDFVYYDLQQWSAPPMLFLIWLSWPISHVSFTPSTARLLSNSFVGFNFNETLTQAPSMMSRTLIPSGLRTTRKLMMLRETSGPWHSKPRQQAANWQSLWLLRWHQATLGISGFIRRTEQDIPGPNF